MERIDKDELNLANNRCEENEHHSPWGRMLAGLVIVGIGGVWLLKKMGYEIPYWLWNWPMLLIALGFFVGFKHSFRGWSWLIMVLIGGVFMLELAIPTIALKVYAWPLVIIALGLIMIFKPKRKHRHKFGKWKHRAHKKGRNYEYQYEYDTETEETLNEDVIQADTVFGSVKKNIISKNFKGGEINTVFGGAEINLSQADIQGTVVLETNHIFGGSRLVIPSNWKVRSELTSIFGGIEDNRPPQQIADDNKVLVLKGSVIFGGIDISSF